MKLKYEVKLDETEPKNWEYISRWDQIRRHLQKIQGVCVLIYSLVKNLFVTNAYILMSKESYETTTRR